MNQGIVPTFGASPVFVHTNTSGAPPSGGYIEQEGSIIDMILSEDLDFILQE